MFNMLIMIIMFYVDYLYFVYHCIFFSKSNPTKSFIVLNKTNSRKSTRCPYVSVCECVVVRGAAAPKGPMTYAGFI